MFMSLKCVSVKSGTCTASNSLQDSREPGAGQAAAALFDVGGRFEGLSDCMEGGKRFFLVQAVHLITPSDMDANAHAGIRIHLHAFICTREGTDIGQGHAITGGRLLKTHVETYSLSSHVPCEWRGGELALSTSNCTHSTGGWQ